MTAPEAFIWTPYDQILGQLPAFCRAGEHMWTARCPLIHMDIVEHHAPDRVLRQFGHVQNIPAATHWEHYHYTRDERSIDSTAWRARMHQEVNAWNKRMTTLAAVGHDTPVHEYMTWYMHITRSLVANPSTPRPDGRGYASLSGAYEALLRMTLMIRHESIPLTECTDPGIVAYAARIVHLTDTGMTRNGVASCRGCTGGCSGVAPSATDTLSSSRPSTSQRPGYTPEMFPRYDPWSSFPQMPVGDLHIGGGDEDLDIIFDDFFLRSTVGDLHMGGGDEDLDIIFDDFFLRSTAGPSAPSASPAPRAAQEPSHMPSQEPVHSSAPVDPSPPV
ncbi:serine/threonine-protein phosphatase 7 long form homolog [Lycium ferocissimum]|uniref:serine/threonine-protein phosphatase 7 long form homolog n=1 Tax=Lycium ferocissimum TaxID=112874 RepID=UPI0028157DED|nr:serine/threonine-protein phosphatase 7 long form homolog [Lycium ferocissimum]